ncbi:MAG: hypothetical protein N3A63_01105 [Bacteroidetes bacterium]|nr:hypothetical protein [Bacteroidota bacterium]
MAIIYFFIYIVAIYVLLKLVRKLIEIFHELYLWRERVKEREVLSSQNKQGKRSPLEYTDVKDAKFKDLKDDTDIPPTKTRFGKTKDE